MPKPSASPEVRQPEDRAGGEGLPERPAPTRRGRGRRPIGEVRADVLAAAASILFRDGMAAFTIERVAAESGASKTTIYKTWPSKGALAFDGYFHATQTTLEFPDSGEITADLLTQLHAFVHLTTATPAGRVICELIGHAQTDPDLAAAMHARFSGPRLRMAVDALNRARERGQISSTTDPEAVVDQLWGACYHRLLVTGLPVTEEFVDKLVANLIGGIRPVPNPEQNTTPGASRSSAPRPERHPG